jgi:hypothetical protein
VFSFDSGKLEVKCWRTHDETSSPVKGDGPVGLSQVPGSREEITELEGWTPRHLSSLRGEAPPHPPISDERRTYFSTVKFVQGFSATNQWRLIKTTTN